MADDVVWVFTPEEIRTLVLSTADRINALEKVGSTTAEGAARVRDELKKARELHHTLCGIQRGVMV